MPLTGLFCLPAEIATRMAESAAKDTARISQSFIPPNANPEEKLKNVGMPDAGTLAAVASTRAGHREHNEEPCPQVVWGS